MTTHGLSYTAEYSCWSGMLQRRMRQTTPVHVTIETPLAETLTDIARHQDRPLSRVCSDLLVSALADKGVIVPEPDWSVPSVPLPNSAAGIS
jgi:hypothetical protein